MASAKTCQKCMDAATRRHLADRENRLQYLREYHQKNYPENRDSILEANRQWREANPERHALSIARWQAGNPERVREIQRKWEHNNPDKVRSKNQKRRARKLGATTEQFTRSELISYWVDNGIDPDACVYCPDGLHEHDDHVIPLSRGGTHERANLVPSCAKCNLSKGSKLLEEWCPEPIAI